MTQTTNPAGYPAITSRLGVWAGTTVHTTQAAAERAARAAIKSGVADSAAVYDGQTAVAYFGTGR